MKYFYITLAIVVAGLAVKYWWVVLTATVLFFAVRTIKRRNAAIMRERKALAARADMGYRNHLDGGTGLFDENNEMYYPSWLKRENNKV